MREREVEKFKLYEEKWNWRLEREDGLSDVNPNPAT